MAGSVDEEYDAVLTAEEAAALLRVSLQTVLKESRLGQLPGIKIGREWRYSRQALLTHLRQYPGTRDELGDSSGINEVTAPGDGE